MKCGNNGDICIQKNTKNVSEQQCKAYAKLLGEEFHTTNNTAYPKGCILMSNNRVRWENNGGGDRNNTNVSGNCIQLK